MEQYSMTYLSMKQCLLDVQVKRLKRLNRLVADMAELDEDTSILNSIQDICCDIKKCSDDIKEIAENIKSYATLFEFAMNNLVEQQASPEKSLKSTLDALDKSREANAAELAEGKLPVINNVDDVDPYVAKVGEAGQNG